MKTSRSITDQPAATNFVFCLVVRIGSHLFCQLRNGSFTSVATAVKGLEIEIAEVL